MNTKYSKKLLSFSLCMALAAAAALFAIGCNSGSKDAASSSGTGETIQAEGGVLGEGSTEFTLTVTDKEGSETQFEIHTDKETVGDALLELELIAGDAGEYGLYIKTVNGITADYDKDGAYWAFYINDEYALTGVDSTAISEGDDYSLRIE